MDLRQPVVFVPGLVLVAAIVILVVTVLSRRADGRQVAVANSDDLRTLPQFQAALRAHRLRLLAFTVSAVALVGSLLLGAARPTAMTVETPKQSNRDIVLCLDVSGSMTRADSAIVKTFLEIVKGFQGERISLMIFDSTAVGVFPLTDDYDFIREQLTEARRVFDGEENPLTFFEGTRDAPSSSLIGDGLASCISSFDQLHTNRARSVVFATDNLLAGEPLFSLKEAGELAKTRGVRVYGINPAAGQNSSAASDMRKVVEGTGGAYHALTSPDAVSSIIGAVEAQEATLIDSAPRRYRNDSPALPLVLSGCCLFLLLATARRWSR